MTRRAALSSLKVAIVHDILTHAGGAEKVVEAILKLFPTADVYTSLIDNGLTQLKNIRGRVIKHWKYLPIIAERSLFTRFLIRAYWESLDFSAYSLVISSSDVFSSKSIITKPETLHVCYCHAQPKDLYPVDNIGSKRGVVKFFKTLLLSRMRMLDFVAAQRPDFFIANSKTVQERIRKYYRRDAVVVYPPVLIPQNPPVHRVRKDYYVFVGSLEKSKGVELAIDACNKLQKKLIIIGTDNQSLKQKLRDTRSIVLTGYISEKEKIHYLQHARAFLFPATDEDFGMALVEAMGHGTPVIAYWGGGVRETVIEGKTGLFFREHSVHELIKTMNQLDSLCIDPLDCYAQAKKFSYDTFQHNFSRIIKGVYANHNF